MSKFLTPKVRLWAYGVIAAVAALLATLGYITPEVNAHVLTIAMAVLAVSGSALSISNIERAPDAQESGRHAEES